MVQASVLFKKKYSLKNLNSSYVNIIKRNTASGVDKMRKTNFDKIKEEQIELIHEKVNSGTYKYTVYKEKLILKNRDSLPRMISIPTLRDRIVLKLLHESLMETFGVEMKLVQTVMNNLIIESGPYDSYIKIDIENFFGSINHDILMKKLQRKIRKKEIKNLIINAIKNPTVNQYHRKNTPLQENKYGVPQGVPIANVLAEIFLKDLDESYNKKRDLAYFRYVDDIIILCRSSEVSEIKNGIIEDIINNFALKVNMGKTKDGSLADGMNFLGYSLEKVDGQLKCSVKKESILKIENSLIAIFSKYKNSKGKMSPKEFAFYLNLKITGSIVNDDEQGDKKKYGWLFFYSQINDIRLLYHLDYLVNKFIHRHEMVKALENIEIKSFVKAYYEITQRRSKSKYIFRPSELDIKQKRELLNDVFAIPLKELNTNEKVSVYFYKKVIRKIEELEMDIQNIS